MIAGSRARTTLGSTLVTLIALSGIYLAAGPGPTCDAVRELLEYNRVATQRLNDATVLPEQGSTAQAVIPTAQAYDAWIAGLDARAAAINDAELADVAQALAQSARTMLHLSREDSLTISDGDVLSAATDFATAENDLAQHCGEAMPR